MDSALLTARVLLAVVFTVAGLAKLADRAGSRQAIRNFGVPALLAAPLGVLLPLAELAVAVALVPRASAWWGAAGALAFLLLFIAGIGVNLARGRTPDCHCFGQLYSAPIGWPTLVRNAILAAVAGFVLWQGRDDAGRSAVSWLGDLTATQWAGLVGGLLALSLLASLVWLVIRLLGQSGRLLMRIEALEARLGLGGDGIAPVTHAPATPPAGLPVGVPAPTFSLPGLHGEMLTLDALRAPGRPVLLLFTDPGCGPCNALLPEIGRWQREYAAQMAIALISRGSPDANRVKSSEHGVTHVLLQRDREVQGSYLVAGTPSAVVVRPDGTIGSLLAEGAEAVRALVVHTAGTPMGIPTLEVVPAAALHTNGNGRCPHCGQVHEGAAAPAPPAADRVGQPAPALRLPDLAGKTVDLADFRGSKTAVLFWDPGCGFCKRMLPDLKAWEAKPPEGAPKLLVVSRGTVEDNRAMGLRAPVVLDQGFTAGRAFGADGTPMAILVDEEGRITSSLAEGAPAVLALLQVHQDQAKPA